MSYSYCLALVLVLVLALAIIEVSYDANDTKDTLLQYVRANRPAPAYAAQLIAADYGHLLYYTPPYHPDLQPIELIWGRVKNQIATNPSRRIGELKEKLQAAFDGLTSEHWVAAFKHVQRFENEYKVRIGDDDGSESDSAAEEDPVLYTVQL